MKILHITNFYITHEKIGGAERAVERFIKEDRKNEHHIMTLPFKGNHKNTFKVSPLKFLRNLHLTLLPFDFIVFFQSLYIFKKINPDTVYVHNLKDITFAPLIVAKLFGKKIRAFIYDYWYFCPYSILFDRKKWEVCKSKDCYNCFGFIGKFFRIRKNIFNVFLKTIDEFVVLSESSRQILKKHGISDEKIQVKMLKYEIIGKIENKEEPNTLLYIGWIVPQKGLHVLIKALSKIKDEDFKLYVIGDDKINPPYTEHIKKLIKDFKLEGKVEILGRMKFEEVKEFYSRARVIIIPEQWENMSPLVLVEAVHYGKRVIASKIGGLPEILGNKGILVEPKDYKGFANAIKSMIAK